MIMLKLTRKIGKLIRGGVSPRAIFLGSLLGFVIGMMPGFSLTLLAAIGLLLVLNAHVGLALLGFALGKALCLLLAPVTFQIGYALIHGVGLEPLFRLLANAPVLALMDLHVYCMTGGLAVGLAVGGAFGWCAMTVVKMLRKGVTAAGARSALVQKISQNKLARLFLWVVFGKRKKGVAEGEAPGRLLRKSGVVFAVAALAIAGALEMFLLDAALRRAVEGGLGAAIGAEVNVAEADLSLASGRLALRDLQATDPDSPAHNLFQAAAVTADLSVRDLLRKRFVIDLLEIGQVELHTQRTSPGRVFRAAPKEAEEPPEEAGELADYFEKAAELRRYLPRVADYLKRARARSKENEERPEHKASLRKRAAAEGYFSLSAAGLLAEHPTWVVRKVKVGGLPMPLTGARQDIEAADLSSHPELLARPLTLDVSPADGGRGRAGLVLHFEDPDAMHTLVLILPGVPLGRAVGLSDRVPVRVDGGRARIRLKGRFSGETLDMAFAVKLAGLGAGARDGRSVLGMDAKATRQVFDALDGFTLVGGLSGKVSSPKVTIDTALTLASIKQALMDAGKEELARRATEQIEKLGDEVKERLEDALEGKVPEGLLDGLDLGIPGLGGDEQPDDEDEEKGEKKKPEDLIRDLF